MDRQAIGKFDVECPACGQTVHVKVMARSLPSPVEVLHIGLEPRFRHDCPAR